MKRIGKTAKWGIPKPEKGLFVASLSYTPEFETTEQLDNMGEYSGLVLHKEKVTIELSGEVPYVAAGATEESTGLTLGAAIKLQNACPASCWLGGETPNATTSVLTAAPYTLTREGPQEQSYTGAIYAFDSSTTTDETAASA